MRKALLITIVLSAATSLTVSVWALCSPVKVERLSEENECSGNYRVKREFWQATFNQDYDRYKDALVTGTALVPSCSSTCYPGFDNATVEHGTDSSGRETWKWIKKIQNKNSACETYNISKFEMNHTCPVQLAGGGGCNAAPDWGQYPSTGCESGFIYNGSTCTRNSSFTTQCSRFGGYDPETCSCAGGCEDGFPCSPILIDTAGDGFALTDAADGVDFDLGNDGVRERRAWTLSNTDDAWLALDRNHNGTIDGGRELFGNASPQSPPPDGEKLNGFLALAEFDRAAQGGNEDGWVGPRDAVFAALRLWRDTNHNGVSEAEELHPLSALGVLRLDLDYRESRRVDARGNEFKYRAKVRDARGEQVGRWAWDVFLVRAP